MEEKKTYSITVSDKRTYKIRASSPADAEALALEWFSEREPSISIEVTDESPEIEI